MTGTMPFTLDYPWDNEAGVAALYQRHGKEQWRHAPARKIRGVGRGLEPQEPIASPVTSPGRVMWAPADYMNYQNGKWTVYFLAVPLDTGTYRTISSKQDSPDCPAVYNSPEFVHTDSYHPEVDCIVSDEPVPFDFSTGSGF